MQARILRIADRDELERLATRLAPVDAERALAITERALEDQPRHAGLVRPRLAELRAKQAATQADSR